MSETAEVIVIGGGVMGCSIAYHLTRRGVRDVLVLEKGGVCSGMTRRSGALVRMHYTNPHEIALALVGLRYFQHWGDVVGGECGFRPTGFVMAVDHVNEQRLRRAVAMQQSLGVDTRAIGPAELRELQPHLYTGDMTLAAYEPQAGYADPVATTLSFARAARDGGARIREGVTVTALRVAGGRVRGVQTDQGSLDAPVVVLAAGPWAGKLAASAGVALPIHPQRAQIAFFRRPPALAHGHAVVLDLVTGGYLRPHPDGTTLMGTGAASQAGSLDPDHFNTENDPGYAEPAMEKLAHRLPEMRGMDYAHGHAGLYDMTPDTRAIIDRAPGVDGLYLAGGFSGTGFKKSPAVGACISELITTGHATTAGIAPFRLARFTEEPADWGDEYDTPVDLGHRF